MAWRAAFRHVRIPSHPPLGRGAASAPTRQRGGHAATAVALAAVTFYLLS
jgi:hypothetical protein